MQGYYLWVNIHLWTTLIGLFVWVQVLPESTHLDHWSSHWFNLNNPDVFLPTVVSILLLGPFSILALWGLKKQVLALEKENQKLLWAADRYNIDPEKMAVWAFNL